MNEENFDPKQSLLLIESMDHSDLPVSVHPKKNQTQKGPYVYRLHTGLCVAHFRDRYFSAGIFDWPANRRRLLHTYQSNFAYYLWYSNLFVRNYFEIQTVGCWRYWLLDTFYCSHVN